MVGLNRIWRIATSSSSVQEAIGEGNNTVIEFDESLANDKLFVTQTTVTIDTDITQTSALKGDINPLQDGGVGGVTITINGVIKGKNAIAGRQLLTRWNLESKTTPTFPHGRFGTVFNDLKEFDITPLGTAATGYGWMIEDIQFIKDGEWQNKTPFVITLRYNGSKAGIIANLPAVSD